MPSQRGFKLASLNISKLTTHIDELRIFVAYYAIDTLSIYETKLNETISDNEVNILGYDLVRHYRTTDAGGGVCFFMLIGSRQRLSTLAVSPTITIYDNQVSQVTTAKSFGVTIDNKLDWSSHIDKLTKKVASGIGAIKRIRHLVSQATLLLIYQALIQPHFDYCNIVWGDCVITLQNKVQKLQNGAVRVLTYSNYDTDAGYLLKLLRWKNLACQQQIQRATMVYKSLHGLAPDYLCSKFERRETAYNLWDPENKLNVPLPRTNYYKSSFRYSGTTLWNRLPRDMRQAKSLGLFKRLIREDVQAQHSWKAPLVRLVL